MFILFSVYRVFSTVYYTVTVYVHVPCPILHANADRLGQAPHEDARLYLRVHVKLCMYKEYQSLCRIHRCSAGANADG